MSEVRAKIHPLVVLNIADHHARRNPNLTSPKQLFHERGHVVVGALFGTQEGAIANVADSFEVSFTVSESGQLVADEEALTTDVQLYKEVFPQHEVLGLYATGAIDGVPEQLMSLYRLCRQRFSESPLLLLLDPRPTLPDTTKDADDDGLDVDLPIKLYEQIVRNVDGNVRTSMEPQVFSVVADDAERICTEHVAQSVYHAGTTAQHSKMTRHLRPLREALQALLLRVARITEHLQQVEEGKLPRDEEVLLAARRLADRLPVLDPASVERDITETLNDSMLVTLLALFTKGAAQSESLQARTLQLTELRQQERRENEHPQQGAMRALKSFMGLGSGRKHRG